MENQQEQSICSPLLAELPTSLPPVPPQDSSSQKTLTLSERMRTQLGDNCMLALDQPELRAESLAALDQADGLGRSIFATGAAGRARATGGQQFLSCKMFEQLLVTF